MRTDGNGDDENDEWSQAHAEEDDDGYDVMPIDDDGDSN